VVQLLARNPGRGQMCHARRVTEAGATPRIPVTHRASKGGVAPASFEFCRVLPSRFFAAYVLSFHEVHFSPRLK
jgi:hypothetical protein